MIPKDDSSNYVGNKNNDGIQLGELLNDRFEPNLIKGLLIRNSNKYNITDVTVEKNGKKRLEFESQGPGNYNCKIISDKIIKPLKIESEGALGKSNKFGCESFYQFGLENENGTEIIFENSQKRKQGIEYIDKALFNGDPVVIGVHYRFRKDKKSHNEGTTDHYSVI